MPPIIVFAGDTHAKSMQLFDALADWQDRVGVKIDAIVQIGDFGVFRSSGNYISQFHKYWDGEVKIPIPTYVLMGNHEDIATVKLWESQPDKIPNLHLIQDGSVIDVEGIKMGGIWGNYSPRAWMNPWLVADARARAVPGSKRAMHIWRDSVEKLLSYEGTIDVLLSHDSPSCFVPHGFEGPVPDSLKPLMGLDGDEIAPPGCPGFTQLLERFQPSYYFFGHFHTRDERRIGNTDVTCLHAFDQAPVDALTIIDFERIDRS